MSNNGMAKRPQLYRNEIQVAVGTVDTRIVGPNPRRYAIIFGTPMLDSAGSGQTFLGKTVSGHGLVFSAVGGTALSYTVPTGKNALLTTISFVQTGGSPTLSLHYIPSGGVDTNLTGATANAVINRINLPMKAGDQALLEWSAGAGGNTLDAFMGIEEFSAGGVVSLDATVWLSLDGPAVAGNGMPLHPGADNFVLLYDHIGQAITEEIRGISGSGTNTITIWDIFEVNCPCQG